MTRDPVSFFSDGHTQAITTRENNLREQFPYIYEPLPMKIINVESIVSSVPHCIE